jgi:micrococcal nuclease
MVVSVADGDTIRVRLNNTNTGNNPDPAEESVRLIGIDTPETKRPNSPVECFGPEATNFTTALLPAGTAIRIERDVEQRDQYGRLLGYVFRAADGLFVNEALARHGFAQQLTYPPNVAYADRFSAAVGIARDQQLGLWSRCEN